MLEFPCLTDVIVLNVLLHAKSLEHGLEQCKRCVTAGYHVANKQRVVGSMAAVDYVLPKFTCGNLTPSVMAFRGEALGRC